MHSDNVTNLMIDVADPVPISSFGPPAPKQVRYVNGGETITDPSQVAALNGNGLMSVHGLAFVDQPVGNGRAHRRGHSSRERGRQCRDAGDQRRDGWHHDHYQVHDGAGDSPAQHAVEHHLRLLRKSPDFIRIAGRRNAVRKSPDSESAILTTDALRSAR